MTVERKNISIDAEIYERGLQVMKSRAISKFSQLLAILIREEYDRRHGGMPIEYRMSQLERAIGGEAANKPGTQQPSSKSAEPARRAPEKDHQRDSQAAGQGKSSGRAKARTGRRGRTS